MKEKLLEYKNANIKGKYRKIRRFLRNPLPDFTYTHSDADGSYVDVTFTCVRIK